MRRFGVVGAGSMLVLLGTLVFALAALGATRGGVQNPFAYSRSSGFDGGPVSGLWGDGGSGPKGIELGCIPSRHFAMAVPITNQAGEAVTIDAVAGTQAHGTLVRRVAVQAWPKPAESGDMIQVGLHDWSRTPGQPLVVPASSDAWLQLNFLMGQCRLIKSYGRVAVSDRLTITYEDQSGTTAQETTSRVIPLILRRASRTEIAAYRANPNAG